MEVFRRPKYPGIVKSNLLRDGRKEVGKVYHDLRKTSSEGARLLVRKVLEQKGGSVSKTERMLGISPEDPKKGKGRLV
uniref:Uncharacterized protein n=1 Tax=candidate division WOR-3 bacterium TaxID=2052148 RepID=A0A7C2K3B4_UNCW3